MIIRTTGEETARGPQTIGDTGPETGEIMLKKIIVPVDGSRLAEQVLPNVINLARGMGLEVTLVRVIPHFDGFGGTLAYPSTEEPAPFHMGVQSEMYDAMVKEEEDKARDYLRDLKGRLLQEGVTTASEVVVWGSAEEAVLDLSRGTRHSLVAMTTHGRSGMGRWVLGSVTDRVVRHSGDPVLVVRGVTVESAATDGAPGDPSKEEAAVS